MQPGLPTGRHGRRLPSPTGATRSSGDAAPVLSICQSIAVRTRPYLEMMRSLTGLGAVNGRPGNRVSRGRNEVVVKSDTCAV